MLETHPDRFEEAMNYKKLSTEPGKRFTWNQEMSLSKLRKPENVAAIKQRFAENEERNRKNRATKKPGRDSCGHRGRR